MSTLRQRFSSASASSAKRNGKATTPPTVPSQTSAPQPAAGDRDGWCAHWQAQDQPWRTEPEIDQKRQADLSRHRAIVPDIEKGFYPFQGMKLSRADVEWLLATHENGRGPVDWSDEHQRKREGLDLRGTNLSSIDLSHLPLARLRGGLTEIEWNPFIDEPKKRIGIVLEKADLRGSHLEGAILRRANLREASLSDTYLQEADLESSHLEAARFRRANLEGASLRWASLEDSHLRKAILKNTDLRSIHLDGTYLSEVVLWDDQHIGPQLADVHWEGANLSVIEWPKLRQLGDEQKARKQHDDQGVLKSKAQVLEEYETAVRANRQLAIALQNQGINEDASYFAYRAQMLQKTTFRLQMVRPHVRLRQRLQALEAWLFSWFLFLLAGYGFKPGRSFLAYLLVISAFLALYLHLDPHLTWYEAIVVSMTAFHGRGFSPGTFSPGDPVSIASAIEAFVGLIIEVTFIATLTRRFFGQ